MSVDPIRDTCEAMLGISSSLRNLTYEIASGQDKLVCACKIQRLARHLNEISDGLLGTSNDKHERRRFVQ